VQPVRLCIHATCPFMLVAGGRADVVYSTPLALEWSVARVHSPVVFHLHDPPLHWPSFLHQLWLHAQQDQHDQLADAVGTQPESDLT